MEQAIISMFERYNCVTDDDYKNALKEIIQEVVLLGLWRSKFFEHAAFYGGTALRILYKLDRYSEDLDFSLIKPDIDFNLETYHKAVKSELLSFGFDVEIKKKTKSADTTVQSAFLKSNTKEHLFKIGVPNALQKRCHTGEILEVKFEVDIEPPGEFTTEVIGQLQPVTYWIRSYVLSDLFAGKLHALLCRQWKNRVKGRDWYDFMWYVKNGVKANLKHLEKRMQQSGHFPTKETLDIDRLKVMLHDKVESIDIESAKRDVRPYIKDKALLDSWTAEGFKLAANHLENL